MKKSLTFDDVLMVPGFSQVLPGDVDLKTRFSRSIELNIPLVSAAMDTVTESRMAIAMAQLGGIGVIHRNMDARKQAAEVALVKRYESGIVRNPITLPHDVQIEDARRIMADKGISAIPIINEKDGYLEGIVTARDLRYADQPRDLLGTVMTSEGDLITINESQIGDERLIRQLLHTNKIEKILVVEVDPGGMKLTGLVTSMDLQKKKDYPRAVTDKEGRLRVAAAISGMPTQDNLQRADKLIVAGVDALVIDCAHGHTQNVLDTIREVRNFMDPWIDIVAGNVATLQGAIKLLEAHVDGIKVGIGPGSICTTRVIAGIGVPQFTAIQDVASIKKGGAWDSFLIPVIADGGIRYSGDMAKAIGIGADCVMIGSLFAGTEEAPGETELYQGRTYKSYRGMGSMAAMEDGSADRYFQGGSTKLVPEGIEGRVPYKGPLEGVVHQLVGGLQASMGYTGKPDIESFRGKAEFTEITSAGVTESHPHDVDVTKESPNYQVRR